MKQQGMVRIGGASGHLGDSSTAAPQLLRAGGLDYLILDYLAEATMSVLARSKVKRADAGYARDFTDWVWKDNLRELKAQGVKVVTNAGGVNARACRDRMEALAAEAGLTFKIAVVEGDDAMSRLQDFKARGLTEMFSGAPFPDPDKVLSANVYLGAGPIAAALAAGADVVITGRVVDSALTLGPLIHEFGWSFDDYDRLAAGSLAGHVIECGAQATGGLFTDWERVPDWAHIGYPIIECSPDGSFVVTKPDGSGGLCEPATVAEQVLYEIGDPTAYFMPDVVCDFTQVKAESVGLNRVRVTGTKGRPPSGKYKVCVIYRDGFRCITVMPVLGMNAAAKARRQSEALIERTEEMLRDRNLGPYRRSLIEVLGAEASYGARGRGDAVREVVCKLGVEHEDEKALEVFLREFESPSTSMSAGTAGWFGGRPSIAPVARVFSIAIDRAEVPASVSVGGETITVTARPPKTAYEPAAAIPAPSVALDPTTATVPLVRLAWGRSGDKGDAYNIGIIARDPAYLPYIRAALTEAAVMAFFAHDFADGARPSVTRYEVPGLNALNFHCRDSLGGGQMASLRVDPLAKGKAQQLLEFEIPVPASIAGGLSASPTGAG
jgi:hypothetical protein